MEGDNMETVIEVVRNDVGTSRVAERPEAALADGQTRFTVERFALTSNNITYAVFGEAMRYWDFFPVPAGDSLDDGRVWGRVPVWGFAVATESRCADVPVGTRVYGYLPMANTLVMTPGKADGTGFIDVAAHRAPMATAYNRYATVDNDPAYLTELENHQMVLWPLFMTSFMIDDFIAGEGSDRPEFFGASVAVISSASSKTSIGAAFLMKRRGGVTVIGLTSPSNRAFVESLGCYDRVVTYGDEGTLPDGPAVYVDIAGDRAVNQRVHGRYDDELVYSMIVGGTHWNVESDGDRSPLAGPKPEFFFAPSQIALRSKEWGKAGLDARVGEAWREFARWSDEWLDYRSTSGAEPVRGVFDNMATGVVDPRVGLICRVE
jgi:hypothetical protein